MNLFESYCDISLEYQLQDLMVGVCWRREIKRLHIWIYVIPCLPIHLEIYELSKIDEVKSEHEV